MPTSVLKLTSLNLMRVLLVVAGLRRRSVQKSIIGFGHFGCSLQQKDWGVPAWNVNLTLFSRAIIVTEVGVKM